MFIDAATYILLIDVILQLPYLIAIGFVEEYMACPSFASLKDGPFAAGDVICPLRWLPKLAIALAVIHCSEWDVGMCGLLISWGTTPCTR